MIKPRGCILVHFMLFLTTRIISGLRPISVSRRLQSHHLQQGSFPSFQSKDPNQFEESTSTAVNNLLGSVIRRASSTISDKEELSGIISRDVDVTDVNDLVETASSRAQGVLDRKITESPSKFKLDPKKDYTIRSGPVERYSGNPAIANTALAHTLWKSILRPYQDAVIDATCGNGHDSLQLARILFPPISNNADERMIPSSSSELLCIDIQQQACENTTMTLSHELDPETMENHVRVLHCSHAPLPKPRDDTSVGLVVYNLGWLPNSDKDCITKMESTIASLVDASLLIRVKGMVSVMTYPKTNPDEDIAVRALLECMALLSSRMQTWQDYLEQSDSLSDPIKLLVSTAMERVTDLGDGKQTWRVSEHKKLGMDRAPILLTATRIK